jgi:two-component system chemotaxis sensor kinase CheA
MKVGDYKALYASEAEEILQALESGVMGLEGCEDIRACIDEVFRNAHNLKGMSGAMGYDAVVEASHMFENVLDRCRRGEISIGSAEVDLLLRAVDLLRNLTQAAIDEGKAVVTEEILGNILVLLSPMSARVGDAKKHSPAVQSSAGLRSSNVSEGESAREEEGRRSNAEPTPDDEGAAEHTTGMDCTDTDTAEAPVTETASPNQYGGPSEAVFGDSEKHTENVHEKSYPKVISTRVKLESLDRLMDLVGELIISRIRLTGLARELGSKPLLEELVASGRLVSQIQKEVMEARLVPVGEIFQRFKRLVRDISRELGKKVELEIIGAEIGLDRTVLESMVEPLVHLVRNALDHGVEPLGDRRAAGKPEAGRVVMSARRDRNFVIIEVADDGRGIDFERVLEKGAGHRGRDESEANLTDEELCTILTTPGFSTSENVGRYSGRGMGMDIVKKKVDSFGGLMGITSKRGKGTKVALHLPINLSIIKALLFYIGDDVHAIPIEYISETTRVETGMFKKIQGQEVLPTDNGAVPLVRPSELFGLPVELEGDRYIKVIVAETGEEKVGLVVNRIIGQQEIVIKGLPTMIRSVGGISGATILGSGKIAFIWDLRELFKGRYTDEPDQKTVVFAN